MNDTREECMIERHNEERKESKKKGGQIITKEG